MTQRRTRETVVAEIREKRSEIKNGHLKNSVQILVNLLAERGRYNDTPQKIVAEYLAGVEKAKSEDLINYGVILYIARSVLDRKDELGEVVFHLYRAETMREHGKTEAWKKELALCEVHKDNA